MRLRALRVDSAFAAGVVGSLAVGIAVAIAALALLNALLFRPFPAVTAQDRLVRVAVSRACGDRPDCWTRMTSAADYDALREGLTGLQGLAAYSLGEVAAALPAARSLRGALTSTEYFDVLGVRPALGRTFNPADRATQAAVAVIAHHVWIREFERDGSVLGRSIRVGDRFVEIVGVAPEFFAGIDMRVRDRGRGPDLWLPIWLADDVLPLTPAERRQGGRDAYFAGRLRDGVTPAEIQAEAAVVAARMAARHGLDAAASRAEVVGVWRTRPQNRQLTVLLIMPIPLLVLLIACVNAANLMLARGSQRQREIAIRLALGAGRGRIVRELMAESAALTCLAAAIAAPVTWWALRLAGTPLNFPIPFDVTVLALTLLTAAGTTVAAGLVPALRISVQPLSTAIGPSGGRFNATPRQLRVRRALVVAQVALSLALLATAWQLVATVRAQDVSTGTPPDRLLMASFDLQPFKPSPPQIDRFYGELLEAATRLPGVEAAGIARPEAVWSFGRGASAALTVWQPAHGPQDGQVVTGGYAGGDLFRALGLRTVQGRAFTAADRQGRPQVAVVNQAFAARMGAAALGSTLHVAPRGSRFTAAFDVRVVGIVEASSEPKEDAEAAAGSRIYLPSPLEPEPALALYVSSRTPAAPLAESIREVVARIDARVPVAEMGTLEDLNERAVGPQLWLARAAAVIGAVGLMLATAGLYSMASFVVAMRSREMAIRIAIGAGPRAILAMVLGQSMRLAVVGLLAGTAAALTASRIIQSEYHGIHDIDPLAFGGSAALFVAAMLVASAVPAIRASRVDPIESLKEG